MAKINVLSFAVANLIAAGEVVDRPASVIKELMENAIDAGAKHITVEVQNGGVTFMRVADDGCGIDPDDLPVAIRRHATSKIREADDLDGILTLGFRGEALAAIAAVSDLRIITRTKDAPYGTMLVSSAGEVKDIVEQGSPIGTTVIVENLFGNVPARRKFLKKDAAETMAVTTYVEKIALSRPDIAVRLITDGNLRLDTAGDGTLESAMYAVFGRDFVKRMLPVCGREGDSICVEGYVGRPDNVRPKRNYQNFFINGRYINSRTAAAALEQAYTSFIAPEKFPCCVLNITIPPKAVDVNVHPAKLEVKFSNEKPVFEAVYYAVRAALEANCERPDMTLGRSQPAAPHAFAPVQDGRAESLAARQVTMPSIPVQQREQPAFGTRPSIFEREGNMSAANTSRYGSTYTPSRAPITVPHVERVLREQTPAPASVPTPTPTPAPTQVRVEAPVAKTEVEQTLDWRIIGEAFHCYVIVERGDELLLIDKHAAHERILFEELKKKLQGAERASQMMMLPLEPDFTLSDVGALNLYRASIEAIGFGFTVEGGKVRIDEIPAELAPDAAEALLMTLAAGLHDATEDPTITRDLLFEKALYQAACKAAIKGGREYPPEYVSALCAKLFALPDITVCPHGRPVAMTLSHANIDRQFRRS